jgi:hypothetical protein
MASLGVYLLDGGKTERMPTIFSTQSALRFIFFLIKEGRRKTGKQKKNEESKKPRRKKYLFKISTTLFSTNRSGRVFIRSRITRKDFHYIVHSLSLSLSLCLYQLHRSAKLVESFAALPLWHSSTGASNDPVWDLLFFP